MGRKSFDRVGLSVMTVMHLVFKLGRCKNPIDPVENDFFPFLIRNIYDFKGEVFNRWGEKVYQWTQPLAGWDGRTTSGIVLNGGTYYYVITAKGVDGDAVTDYEIKGAVTLIK